MSRLRQFSLLPWRPIGLFVLAFALLSFAIANAYYQFILTLVLVWALMGIGWNLLSGYTGLISFGHAAFFGLGAYTVSLALLHRHLTPWLGIPLGMLVGSLAGVLIGVPTFRLRGHYFALAMLAYPVSLLAIFQWAGLQEIALPMDREHPILAMQFAHPRSYTMVALVMVALALLLSGWIERSRFGLALRAIRQNEAAAQAAGIDTRRCKMQAMALSAEITAAAGGFHALMLLVVTPQSVFGMLTSAQALVVTLFGGVGTLWGPVIGAGILIPLAEGLNAHYGDVIPGIQGVIYGLALVVIVIWMPEGVYWSLRDRFARRRGRLPVLPDDSLMVEAALMQAVPVVMADQSLSAPAASAHGAASDFMSPPPATASAAGMPRPLQHTEGVQAILDVRSVSVNFGGLRALDAVSFTVSSGEIVGIIGPNGAGKTTLFNLLNGFVRASSGTVNLAGTRIDEHDTYAICRLGVGRTFQVARPFARMSVADNVRAGALGCSGSDEQAARATARALGQVGLLQRAEATIDTLTSKELRLLEIARALAAEPRLLLLDETLAGLGRIEIDELLPVIRALPREGITVVIIEHTLDALLRLADRLLVLDHGCVVAQGEPQAVIREPQVIEAYLGAKWARHAEH